VGKFKFLETGIKDLYVVEPTVFDDHRGFFMETYHAQEFKEAGLDMVFAQDNQSRSSRGVLRGLHFQYNYPQGKLVRVIKGEVFDVAVDLRKDSETFGKWYGLYLSEENKKQFYVPEGFAHGFLVTSDVAEFVYKCTDYYHPKDEGGIIWNDPNVGIEWPLDKVASILLSAKDEKWKTLKETEANFYINK
jgi:dTDP-4-dehydrorhamnose 3,5-epimerase